MKMGRELKVMLEGAAGLDVNKRGEGVGGGGLHGTNKRSSEEEGPKLVCVNHRRTHGAEKKEAERSRRKRAPASYGAWC